MFEIVCGAIGWFVGFMFFLGLMPGTDGSEEY